MNTWTYAVKYAWLNLCDGMLDEKSARFTLSGDHHKFFLCAGSLRFESEAPTEIIFWGGFARGLKPKVPVKNVETGRHVEQTDAVQVYYGRGSGFKAQRWAIFVIFWNK